MTVARETVEPEAPTLSPKAIARAAEIAGSIQRAVAARPDLAVSIVGVGLDALSTGLQIGRAHV